MLLSHIFCVRRLVGNFPQWILFPARPHASIQFPWCVNKKLCFLCPSYHTAVPIAEPTEVPKSTEPCVSWCGENDRPWDVKCTWKSSCSGCPRCNGGEWFWSSTRIWRTFSEMPHCFWVLILFPSPPALIFYCIKIQSAIYLQHRHQRNFTIAIIFSTLILPPATISKRRRTSRSRVSVVHSALALQAKHVLRNQMQDRKLRTRQKYNGRNSWQFLPTLFWVYTRQGFGEQQVRYHALPEQWRS